MNRDAQNIPPIRFWQQNLNKSLTAQLDLLNQVDPKNTDLIFIQEPHIDFLNLTRANHHWTVIYPTTHHNTPAKTRSVTLVNKTMSKNSWRQVPLDSSDVTVMELKVNNLSIAIYNIYNACESADTLSLLQAHWQARTASSCPSNSSSMIWLGDFNRHHPLWDAPEDHRLFTTANLDAASQLISLLENHNMEMALPAGIPTLQAFRTGNFSRPDNVFCSADILPSFIECDTWPQLRPARTDHFPVIGALDVTPERTNSTPRFNWRLADWDDFRTQLTANMRAMGPPRHVKDIDDFNMLLTMLTAAIQSAADQCVPKTKPSPFTKRWWTKELSDLRRQKKKLRAKSYCLRAQRYHPVHDQAIKITDEYAKSLETTKRKHWDDWLKEVDANNIWTVHKYAGVSPTDGGIARIPTLKCLDGD